MAFTRIGPSEPAFRTRPGGPPAPAHGTGRPSVKVARSDVRGTRLDVALLREGSDEARERASSSILLSLLCGEKKSGKRVIFFPFLLFFTTLRNEHNCRVMSPAIGDDFLLPACCGAVEQGWGHRRRPAQ